MIYFGAKDDLRFINDYCDHLYRLWNIEDNTLVEIDKFDPFVPYKKQQAIISNAMKDPQYKTVREYIARSTPRLLRISDTLNIRTNLIFLPPPVTGGSAIRINIFQAILNDNSYEGVSKSLVMDTLHSIIGESEIRITKELRLLINPLYWLKSLLFWILRIPFVLIEATGFSVQKIEDKIFGKLLKAIMLIFIILTGTYHSGLTKEELAKFLNFVLLDNN